MLLGSAVLLGVHLVMAVNALDAIMDTFMMEIIAHLVIALVIVAMVELVDALLDSIRLMDSASSVILGALVALIYILAILVILLMRLLEGCVALLDALLVVILSAIGVLVGTCLMELIVWLVLVLATHVLEERVHVIQVTTYQAINACNAIPAATVAHHPHLVYPAIPHTN